MTDLLTSPPPAALAGAADNPTALLDRVSVVLDAFAEPGADTTGLSLADIVRRTGLPRSSVHRMLEHLVRLRWIHRTGRHYRLGYRLVELGAVAVDQDAAHAASLPVMYELHAATRLVVHLAVLDGDEVLYLEKVGGRLEAAVPTRIGARIPAASTALGTVLLAGRGDPRVPAPVSASIRAEGLAWMSGPAHRGFSCVAAPIGELHSATAAISLCAPNRHTSLDPRVASPLRVAAARIRRAVDGVPTARRRTVRP